MTASRIPVHVVLFTAAGNALMGPDKAPVKEWTATLRGMRWTLYETPSGEWFEECTRCETGRVHGVCTWCADQHAVRLGTSIIGVRRALRARHETAAHAREHATTARRIEHWAHAHADIAIGLARVRARLGAHACASGRLISLALNATRAPLSVPQTLLALTLLEKLEATR